MYVQTEMSFVVSWTRTFYSFSTLAYPLGKPTYGWWLGTWAPACTLLAHPFIPVIDRFQIDRLDLEPARVIACPLI